MAEKSGAELDLPAQRVFKRRPAKNVLDEEFAFWAGSRFITQETIGELFGITQSAVSHTFERKPRLKAAWLAGRAAAKMSLQQAQFRSATEKDNVVAQIWLGKQYLDQRDSVHEIKTETNVKVEYIATWGGGELPPPEDEDNLIEGEVEDE